jgi:hypothetical protein
MLCNVQPAFIALPIRNAWPQCVPVFGFILCTAQQFFRVIKSKRMRWAEHVARMEDRRGAHRVLVGKREGKESIGRTRPRRKALSK